MASGEMEYYQVEVEDNSGGPTASWGKSLTILYEVDRDGWVVRQIEMFNKGRALFYDQEHPGDEYGELYGQRFDDDDRRAMQPFRIGRKDFERAWQSIKPANRYA